MNIYRETVILIFIVIAFCDVKEKLMSNYFFLQLFVKAIYFLQIFRDLHMAHGQY